MRDKGIDDLKKLLHFALDELDRKDRPSPWVRISEAEDGGVPVRILDIRCTAKGLTGSIAMFAAAETPKEGEKHGTEQ